MKNFENTIASIHAMKMSNNWSRLFGLTSLALAMSACQTVPSAPEDLSLANPNVPLDAGQGYELLQGIENIPSSEAGKRWQDFYVDPKLKALIQIGLENNKDVKQAVLAIQKAQAQYRITESNDAPSIGLNGEYSRGANNLADKNPSDSYQVGLGLASYELDFWGKIANLKDQALQNYLATTAAKDTAQVSLIANIAKSYVNLSYQQAQLQLAEETLKTRNESLRITLARYNAGIDSKAPSLQAAASVETARIAALNAQNNVLKAKNALKYLVGAPIPDDLLPEPAVTQITSAAVISPGLPSDLLRFRPDVLQAEHNLRAAGANIEVARAAYFPSISLTGNLGYRSNDLSDLFKSNAASWSFGPSISLPLFDAGQRDANFEVAQIEREQAVANYESTIEQAFKEVNDVLVDSFTLDERTRSEYQLQDYYRSLYDISFARYNAQVDDYLSVLDAERSNFATQQSIFALEQEKLNNQIELYRALGGGANLDPVPLPESRYINLVNVFDDANEGQGAQIESVATLETVETSQPIIMNDSILDGDNVDDVLDGKNEDATVGDEQVDSYIQVSHTTNQTTDQTTNQTTDQEIIETPAQPVAVPNTETQTTGHNQNTYTYTDPNASDTFGIVFPNETESLNDVDISSSPNSSDKPNSSDMLNSSDKSESVNTDEGDIDNTNKPNNPIAVEFADDGTVIYKNDSSAQSE